MSEGAISSGKYPNYLAEIGISDEEAGKRVQQAFETIFFDPEENFCHHTEEDAWCMVDTGNMDARTEGMSYGMMMCVQMDRKDIFDKLWTFADRYMGRNISPWRCLWPPPGGATGRGFSTTAGKPGRSCATRYTSMSWFRGANPCGNRRMGISASCPI